MKIRFAALIPLVFMMACSNDPSNTTGTDTLKKDSVVATVEAPESNSTLPSPLRVAAMFKRSGLKFLPGLINENEKASNYSTTFIRAENMGVYSADMAYCVLNKQTNEGQQLLKTIRDLGTKINLGKVFEQSSLYDRFNSNIDNEDSLGSIIAEIQFQTDQQLEENQQNELYGVIFAGAWIESMYLGGQVYRKDGNDKIVQALLEQMAVCKNISEELEVNKTKDPNIPGLIADMKTIQDAINAMPSVKKLTDNPDLDFKDVKPDKAEIESVMTKIEDLRKKITNG
ncbi:MAG TPA: hypothetical protein VFJ43_04605 [Bacteroidia bacterium]|nr:hypothetical protein [Bacteroidia bacterium]